MHRVRLFDYSWLVLVLGCGPAVGLASSGTAGTGGESSASAGAGVTTSATAGGQKSSTGVAVSTGNRETSGPGSGPGSGSGDERGRSSTGDGKSTEGLSRILIFHTAHGIRADDAVSADGSLGPILLPLAGHEQDLLFVRGLSRVAFDPKDDLPMDAHSTGPASVLTGGLLGSGSEVAGGAFDPHFGGGPSIDVLLGQSLDRSAFETLHLGVREGLTLPAYPDGVSYLGADQPNAALLDPLEAFEMLFDEVAMDDELQSLASLIDAAGAHEPVAVLEAQLAIAKAALSHDRTRSALVSVDGSVPRIRWAELGVPEMFHEVLVSGGSSQDAVSVMAAWAQRLAALADGLETTLDADGIPLIETTLVVWISEYDDPAAHSQRAFLTILDRSHTFATGSVDLRAAYDQADLGVTLAAAMGVDVGPFGHPELAAEVIEALLAN